MPALGRHAEDFACKNLYALAYHRSSVTHSATRGGPSAAP